MEERSVTTFSCYLSPPDSEPGYMAIGYDAWVNKVCPIWFCSGKDALGEGARWVAEATETNNRRRVLIFHYNEDGKVEGPDMVIETSVTDEEPFEV